MGDASVVLEIPAYFRAIFHVYENLHDVQDREMLDLPGMKAQE